MRPKKIVWLVPGLLGLAMLACNLQAVVEEGQGERSQAVVETVSAYATDNPPAEEVDLEVPEGIALPPTWTPRPPTPTGSPTPPPTEEICSDRAGFVADVTYPDDSEVDAGVAFTKTWRLRNDGTCAWTEEYDLVFDSGDSLGGANAIALTGNVAPGATVDLSAQMTAPNDPGSYQGFWMLRDGEGQPFGLGSNANVAFWVKIVVPSSDMLLQPILPEPVLPVNLYVVSGLGSSVEDGHCFELDSYEMVTCGTSLSDFKYAQVFDENNNQYYPSIVPMNGALFSNVLEMPPPKNLCQSVPMHGSSIGVSNKPFCYRTSGGRHGWLAASSWDDSQITFDWGTYAD